MFGILKFVMGTMKLAGKLIFVMGIGTIMMFKPPVNFDKTFDVIRSERYVYQVNYDKNGIDDIQIFDRSGNYKGRFEYNELKGEHKKIIDGVIK